MENKHLVASMSEWRHKSNPMGSLPQMLLAQAKAWILSSVLFLTAARALHWLWFVALPQAELPIEEKAKYKLQWILGRVSNAAIRILLKMSPLMRVKVIRIAYWLTVSFPRLHDGEHRMNVTSITIEGLHASLYQPETYANGSCIVVIHGGGFFVGNTDIYDGFNYMLSHTTRKTLLALDYPLSPEARYPVALNKLTETVKRIFDDDPSKEFHCKAANSVLFGDSAGGQLAMIISDRLSEKPCLLGLLYPMLQMEDFSTCSYQRYLDHAVLGVLDRDNHEDVILFYTGRKPDSHEYMPWSGNCSNRVRTNPNKDVNIELSPMFMSDERLSKLPQVLLFTCQHDIMLDEDVQFYERVRELKREQARRIHFPRGFHGQAHLVTGLFPYEYGWQMLRTIADHLNSTLATCSNI